MKKATRERYRRIAFAYVIATGGRLPANLGNLLCAIRERVPDVSEGELRDAMAWALRKAKREAAQAERALRNVVVVEVWRRR